MYSAQGLPVAEKKTNGGQKKQSQTSLRVCINLWSYPFYGGRSYINYNSTGTRDSLSY